MPGTLITYPCNTRQHAHNKNRLNVLRYNTSSCHVARTVKIGCLLIPTLASPNNYLLTIESRHSTISTIRDPNTHIHVVLSTLASSSDFTVRRTLNKRYILLSAIPPPHPSPSLSGRNISMTCLFWQNVRWGDPVVAVSCNERNEHQPFDGTKRTKPLQNSAARAIDNAKRL